MKKKLKLLHIVLAVIVLATSACSGTSSQPKVVKIAISTALQHKNIGQQHLAAAQVALEEVGYQVGNVKVELLPLDSGDSTTAFSPDREAEVVQQAISDPAVIAYIGPPTTGQTQKSITLLNQAGIVQLPMSVGWMGFTQAGFAPGQPGIFYPTGTRTFFRFYSSMGDRANVGVDYVVEKYGAKSIYIIDDKSLVFSKITEVVEVHAQDIGLQVMAHDSIDTSTTMSDADLQAAAKKIVAAKPDFLFAGVTLLVGRNFDLMVKIRELDPNIRIFGLEGLLDLPANNNGCQKLEGSIHMIGGVLPENIGNDASLHFMQEFEKLNGGPVTHPFALTVYESTKAILYALEKAKTPTREGVLDAMGSIQTFPDNIVGDWSFTPNGDLSIVVGQISELQDCKWQVKQVVIGDKTINK